VTAREAAVTPRHAGRAAAAGVGERGRRDVEDLSRHRFP
jgi:hypothetical protein